MKPKRLVWFSAVAFSLQMGFSQDFKKVYDIQPGGEIAIYATGDIRIQGYKDIKKVEILATKKGTNRDSITIEDRSSADRIELRIRSLQSSSSNKNEPPAQFPPPPGDRGRFGPQFPPPFPPGSNVDFEIRVPMSIGYNFSWLASAGKMEISDITAKLLRAESKGDVAVKNVRGFINAQLFFQSRFGSVLVDLPHIKEPCKMWFDARNGDVTVTAPSSLSAQIRMISEVGRLKTDFPLDIQEPRFGQGQKLIAEGKLHSGQMTLTITSLWGGVYLRKK
jgi:hypothetical protein